MSRQSYINMDKYKRLTLRVSPSVYRRLVEQSDYREITITDLIREAIVMELNSFDMARHNVDERRDELKQLLENAHA